jgi:hypothetical protein
MLDIQRIFAAGVEAEKKRMAVWCECRALGLNVEKNEPIESLIAKRDAATGQRPMTFAEASALAALAIVDAEDCRAANMNRESRGEALAYDHVQSEAADVLRAELKRRGILKGGQ